MTHEPDDVLVPVPLDVLKALLGDGVERIVAVHMVRSLIQSQPKEGIEQ